MLFCLQKTYDTPGPVLQTCAPASTWCKKHLRFTTFSSLHCYQYRLCTLEVSTQVFGKLCIHAKCIMND